MKNKINIVELIKDCPKGTKLYSPLCGECYFDRINMGTIICKKQNTQEITFTSEGYYMLPVFDDCECVLFPSKECRDWSKFQRPFKDGDIVATDVTNGDYVQLFIFKKYTNAKAGRAHCYLMLDGEGLYSEGDYYVARHATEEEKQKLFKVIEENGYRWNAEKKILEKLIVPKFKVGDKVKEIKGNRKGTIINIYGNSFYEINRTEGFSHVNIANQDEWELVPNKFDISTLKPFDKVLGRSTTDGIWRCDFLFNIKENGIIKYECIAYCYKYCIPFEGNEHLIGKQDDCSEYYKTWED